MFKHKKNIVFHHIPKCGGTSVLSGLALTYFPFRLLTKGRGGFPAILKAEAATQGALDTQCDIYDYRRKILAYHLARGDSPFIGGHYPFSSSLYDRYKDNWGFVILLRDPVKRWYSEYYWNRYKDHEYGKTELDMEAYLASEQGRMNARSYVNYLIEASHPSALASDDEKNQAIANLDCFDVIGILESLNRFRADMKTVFGRKPFLFKRNRNPAPQEKYAIPPLDSTFHQNLLQHLRADIEIYNAAKNKAGL